MSEIVTNTPDLWTSALPRYGEDGHKYDRGVAVIFGAPKMTGATRLAARACARIGAGLVKVIAPAGTGAIYRSTLHEEIMVVDETDFDGLNDPHIKSVLFGPGFSKGDGVDVRAQIRAAIDAPHINGIVLDAGAFLAAEGVFSPKIIVTPHEGEFAKVFPDLAGGKVERALMASKRLGGVVVLKGAQTVVADTEGAILQDRPLPQLATGGTGDVLSGMITGLIAQGMGVKMAAAGAVWMHGECAARFGKGLVASDLPEVIPSVIQMLR